MVFKVDLGWQQIQPNECALCGAIYRPKASEDIAMRSRPGPRPTPPGEAATTDELIAYQGRLISYVADMQDYIADMIDKLFEWQGRIAH